MPIPVIFANIVSTGMFSLLISKVPQTKETWGVVYLIINLLFISILTIWLGVYRQVHWLTILEILGASLIGAFIITHQTYMYYVHDDLDNN